MSADTPVESPDTVLITRHKEGWQAHLVVPSSDESSEEKEESDKLELRALTEINPCSVHTDVFWSHDGSLLVSCTETHVEIYQFNDADASFTLWHCISLPKVRQVWFSPKSTHLITFHNRIAAKDRNLQVWHLFGKIESGGIDAPNKVFEWSVARLSAGSLPFAFSADERLFAFCKPAGIAFWGTDDWSRHVEQHALPKVDCVEFADASTKRGKLMIYKLGAYAKEHKGKPASLQVLELAYHRSKRDMSVVSGGARHFHNADECTLMWSSRSDALLGLVSAEHDSSDSSYYGNQQLYQINSEKATTAAIDLGDGGGPLIEAGWHPNGKEFLVISGHPATVTLWNGAKGDMIDTIVDSSEPRNLIHFSPNNDGAFLWLGAFGNLNGEMSFYHCRTASKSAKTPISLGFLGYAKDEGCRQYSWAPNARFFITARIAPMRQVDNGLRIYSYFGKLVCEKEYARLYQVAFRPKSSSVLKAPEKGAKGAARPSKATAIRYVPPHMRGKGEASASSSSLSARTSTREPKKKMATKERPAEKKDGETAGVDHWPRGRRYKAREAGEMPPRGTAPTRLDDSDLVGDGSEASPMKKRRRKRKRKSGTPPGGGADVSGGAAEETE
jgi:translation initiation factor 2A